MSGFPRPREPVQAHSLLATRPLGPNPKPSNGFGKCLLLAGVMVAVLVGIAVLFNAKLGKVGRKTDAAATAANAALKASQDETAAAVKRSEANAGLLQSIGQALNAQVANGSLTQSQLSAIAAAVAARQATTGGAKAQAGTTPGIPGSRSGGGMSVTPGVPGSATRPVASATTPPPSSSSTSRCVATVNIPPIFVLDGTVCP
jgi:hypothetical protein